MKPLFQGGDVAMLKELVDYEDEAIVKREILSNNDMKLILMAFDGGEKLGPHRAPASAVLVVLEGKAREDHEGEEQALKGGDMIYFEEGGCHSVETAGRMKMALMLTV